MTDINVPAAAPSDPADPELATNPDCADGDVERFIGNPVTTDDDPTEVAIDAMVAEAEPDLDGDGKPDPPDDHEEG